MKTLDILIKKYSSEFKNISECIEKTNNFFNQNYLLPNKYSEFSFPFIPGMIYSFSYNTTTPISKKRKFINRNPIFLFLNYSKDLNGDNVLYGIDLSTIPDTIREIILVRIWNLFYKTIEENTNKLKIPLPLSSNNLEGLLIGTGFKQSIFGFKYKYFNNIKEVKPIDWCKIPFLELDTFEGQSSFEIYREYKLKLK
jgi:hypothetical protein